MELDELEPILFYFKYVGFLQVAFTILRIDLIVILIFILLIRVQLV